MLSRPTALMTSEAGVEAVAQNFLQGNYSLHMEAIAGPADETTPGSPAADDPSNRRAGK